MKRCFSEQNAGWTLVVKRVQRKSPFNKSFVGVLKRSAVFQAFQLEGSSSPLSGVPQEHEVAPRTLLCQQRRVSVPVHRTDIFTLVAQVYRGRQSLRVAQAPFCPDPSRRVRPALGGQIRPAGVSHDHVNSSLLRDLVDGIQGAGHGVSRSAEEICPSTVRCSSRWVGLVSCFWWFSIRRRKCCSSTIRPGCACDYR